MKDPGWTLSDLDGELRFRGIDIDDIEISHELLYEPFVEDAAKEIEHGQG